MGAYDVVKESLRDHGVDFVQVAMQPGKPQGFGLVGDRRVPLFALPGNPVSSYVSFEVFVRPALRRLMGLQPEVRPTLTARLEHALSSPPGRAGRSGRGDAYRAGLASRPGVGSGLTLRRRPGAGERLRVRAARRDPVEAGDAVEMWLLDEPGAG